MSSLETILRSIDEAEVLDLQSGHIKNRNFLRESPEASVKALSQRHDASRAKLSPESPKMGQNSFLPQDDC
jgi:hypothetical protein